MKRKVLEFDIDGTICPQCVGDYENLKPFPEAVSIINKLFDEGFYISFYTSRFMGRCNNDVQKVYETGYDFTVKQLKDWGLKFHELKMGRPRADKIVNDRDVFFERDWEKIYQACKE